MKHKKNSRKIEIVMITVISAILFFLYLKYIPEQFQTSIKNTSPANYSKSSVNKIDHLKGKTAGNEFSNYSLFSTTKKLQKTNLSEILVVITFKDAPINLAISKAPLKFNKNFAYSLTLDDGLADAYTAGYPLLKGGLSSETGQTYPGLFITDGCGNKVPFRAGIALNSVSATTNQDTHDGNTPSSISWDNVKEFYNNKWDILNHSYSHLSGPGTDYNAQVKDNMDHVKLKTGIILTEFVIPSGDVNYTDYAFANGMKAVYNQSDFPGGDGLQIDPPLDLYQFKLFRQFISDDNYQTYAGNIDIVAQKSSSTSHYWYSEFTHHITLKAQGGSLVFPTFKSHMEYLENTYGAQGSDVMWMAPLQEVYEYLTVRDNSALTHTQDNKTVTLHIDLSNAPTDLSKYAMTLNIDSDAEIESVNCDSASLITFNKTGTTKLVNIEWHDHPLLISGILNSKDNNSAPISIYPNPVENEINISSFAGEMRYSKISMINEKGFEILLGENIKVTDKTTIDLSKLNLHKGVYILRVQPEGKRPFEKIIIKE